MEEVRVPGETREYLLTTVVALRTSSSGSMYVVDEQQAQVLVFDNAGAFVRRLGGRGYGPGEFQQLKAVGWIRDTLWVADDALLRVTFFDTAGTVVATTRISSPAVPPGLPTAPDYLLADGSVAVELRLGSRRIAATREFTEIPVLRLSREGQVLDTLTRLPVGLRVMHIPWRGRDLYAPHPMALIPFWAASPDGRFLVVVDLPSVKAPGEGSFRMSLRRADGSPVRTVLRSFHPVDFSSDAADSMVEHIARGLSGALPDHPPPGTLRNLMKEHVQFPAYQPPVSALVVGSDSTIWLRREDAGGEVVVWEVFDWSGSVLANVEAPGNLTVLQAERWRIWGIQRTDEDVPEVVRYGVRTNP